MTMMGCKPECMSEEQSVGYTMYVRNCKCEVNKKKTKEKETQNVCAHNEFTISQLIRQCCRRTYIPSHGMHGLDDDDDDTWK